MGKIRAGSRSFSGHIGQVFPVRIGLATMLGLLILRPHFLVGSETSKQESPSGYAVQKNDHVIYHPADQNDPTMRGFPPLKENRVTIENYRGRVKKSGPEGLVLTKVKVPITRWAHMHMRELFPTQVIRRGNLPVRAFPVKVVELSKIPVPGLDGKKISISEWLKGSETDAFMIPCARQHASMPLLPRLPCQGLCDRPEGLSGLLVQFYQFLEVRKVVG